MNRRDMLRVLGGAVSIPVLYGVSPEQLFAFGRDVHTEAAKRYAQAQGLAVLNEHENQTVTTMAELIIPETDTPGATAAKVNEFIDVLLADWYDEEERTQFLNGLAGVDARSRELFEIDFVDASEAQQLELLSGLDAEVTALRQADESTRDHFFYRMKYLTLYGYYTSEVGVKQELDYAIIPGRYDPCAPLERQSPGGW